MLSHAVEAPQPVEYLKLHTQLEQAIRFVPGETHGLDLCLALKVEPMLAATRVIMLSARGTHADREAGLRAGADAYLVKPFSPMQLLALVDDETVAA